MARTPAAGRRRRLRGVGTEGPSGPGKVHGLETGSPSGGRPASSRGAAGEAEAPAVPGRLLVELQAQGLKCLFRQWCRARRSLTGASQGPSRRGCGHRRPPVGAWLEARRPEAQGAVSEETGHPAPSFQTGLDPRAGVRVLPNLCVINTSDVHRNLFFLRQPPPHSSPSECWWPH